MSVPEFVPANVPGPGPGHDGPAGARPPRDLTGDPSGWRFQMRLPADLLGGDFRLAGAPRIVRASLGPRRRGEAKRLAQQLATLCQAICAAAAAGKDDTMAQQPLSDDQTDLVKQVVAACQNAIARAIAQPSQAIGLAHGLSAALTSLQLVQSETAKGESGARAVVDNADALTRHALADVLRLSSQPARALAALAAVPAVAPLAVPAAATGHPRTNSGRPMPTFGEVSRRYIDMRIEKDGEHHAEISTLELRRQTFIDVVGDRTVDQYYASDLQSYVNKMQFWPANATKRDDVAGRSTQQILDANKNFALKPMAIKTMQDGYVANVRTMMRSGIADFDYHDPFSGVTLRWPRTLRPSKPREGIGTDVINRVFANGVNSGLLDEAMLPLLSKLTSRRLGLLAFLQGPDIRKKHGVWVAQTSGIVFDKDNNRWSRIPLKTAESMTFFVLHDFLAEIGWTGWAAKQDGWLLPSLHEHPDPAKHCSKIMNRLLHRSGSAGGEVFHSIRGDAIDDMRANDVASMPAYDALRKSGLDACGLTQFASRMVGVPFVGLIATAFALSELLRRLHGGEGMEFASGSALNLDDIESIRMPFSSYAFGHVPAV